MPVIRAAVFDESKAYVARRAFSASGRQFTAGEIVPPDAALSPDRFRQWFENRMIIAAPQEMKPNGNGHAQTPMGRVLEGAEQSLEREARSSIGDQPQTPRIGTFQSSGEWQTPAATIAGPLETVPQEPEVPKDPNRIEHVGRGWYDIYVGGVVVKKVRGEDEARTELTLRLGAQITSEMKDGGDASSVTGTGGDGSSPPEYQLDIEVAVAEAQP